MKVFLSRWWFVAAIIVAAALAIFVKPYGIIGIPVIIVLLSMVLPRTSKVSSLLFHNVFLLVILSCAIQVVGIILWLLNIDFTYGLLVVLLALFAIIMYFVRGKILDYTSIIHRDDVISGVIAIVATVIMLIGILHGGGLTQQLLRYITGGFDARQHLSMTVSDYDYHGYVLGYSAKITQELVYGSLGSYPQGWHLNTSFLMSGLSDSLTFVHNYKEILAIFFAAIMLWYALVTFLVSRAVLLIIRALKNIPNSIAYSVALSVSLLLQLTLLVNVVKNGFANFLPALAYLIVVAILGIWVHHSVNVDKKASVLVYGSLLVAGTSFSWSLAAPMAGLLVVAYWLIGFDYWQEVSRWLRRHLVAAITAIVLVILSTIPFIQALTDKDYSVSHHINDPGGIWTISFAFLAVIFIVAAAATLKLQKTRLRLTLMATLLLPTLVYAAVNLYQFYSTGVSTYFSTKVLSLVLILAVIIFGAVLAPYIQVVTGNVKKSVLVIFIVSVGLLLPSVTGYDLSGLQLFKDGSNPLSTQTSDAIINLLNKNVGFKSNVFLVQDNSADVTATLLVESMARTYPACFQSFVGDTIEGDRAASIKDIATCAQQNLSTPYYVISSVTNYDELQADFAPYHNITVTPTS